MKLKWTVKITKNGETDTDYTVVKASKKYKEKKADLTKVRFMDSFAVMSDSLESLGVDEYNRWSEADDSGQGGSVNDLITQVQKEHKDDVLTATSKKVGLDESISELKNMNDKEYNQYSNYYNDMVTFYRTVLNPPAGYKDNFGDKFDDLRDRINNDFDEMSR